LPFAARKNQRDVVVMRIGLDFDNTIIRYDKVFRQAAKERGLVDADFYGTKQHVRDAIRSLVDGELKWQALQGYVYGRGIANAEVFKGVPDFLGRARKDGHTILIVSHKTEYGHFDPERINLRSAALGWMEAHGFFSGCGFSIARDNVYFAATRAEKLNHIASLNCDFFVDDLEEILADPAFPASVERILFSENAANAEGLPYIICRDWIGVEEIIFRERR
jgi:hypothetical protein